jgi:hypothetical protein
MRFRHPRIVALPKCRIIRHNSRWVVPFVTRSRIFPAFLFLLLCFSRTFAHREDYIDETLVFATLDRGEVESQYWFDAGSEDSNRFTRHHLALEYGITDHWMIDGRASGLDENGFHLGSSRLETRYRFFDEGTLPIDIAVSGEVNTHRDAQGHQVFGIEPRLILSKDFGKLNLTVNLAEEIPFTRGHPSLEIRGGWQYDATELFRFGSELRYDTEEHSVALIPQIWFILPHEVTFKVGYFYDFGGAHERFVRVALVKGF